METRGARQQERQEPSHARNPRHTRTYRRVRGIARGAGVGGRAARRDALSQPRFHATSAALPPRPQVRRTCSPHTNHTLPRQGCALQSHEGGGCARGRSSSVRARRLPRATFCPTHLCSTRTQPGAAQRSPEQLVRHGIRHQKEQQCATHTQRESACVRLQSKATLENITALQPRLEPCVLERSVGRGEHAVSGSEEPKRNTKPRTATTVNAATISAGLWQACAGGSPFVP